MQYNQPYDQPTNPTASFVNGNPSAGIQGSIPPAGALEFPQREIVNLITAMGLAPTNNNLTQMLQAAAILSGNVFLQDSGTANALAVTIPSYMSLLPGLTLKIRKGPSANTGAVAVTVNTQGASGSGPTINAQWADGTALGAPNGVPDWPANAILLATYDGSVLQIAEAAGPSVFALAANSRIKLLNAATFYVSPTGSDSNPGTLSAPFQTMQACYNYIANTIDLNGNQVTMQLADGVYTSGLKAWGPLVGGPISSSQVNPLIIQGNNAEPSNVIVSVANDICFYGRLGASIGISGVTLQASGGASGAWPGFLPGGIAIVSGIIGEVYILGNVVFGACGTGHIAANPGYVGIFGNYSIIGGAASHWEASAGGSIVAGLTSASASPLITLTGTPAFTTFAQAFNQSLIIAQGLTFSGGATGQRFLLANSLLNTGGGGASFLPGNTAGSGTTYI